MLTRKGQQIFAGKQQLFFSWGEIMGEWVEWKGGECPVRGEVGVIIRFRDGEEIETNTLRGWFWGRSDNELSSDIIAYRVIEPEQQAHAMSHPALQMQERKHVSDAAAKVYEQWACGGGMPLDDFESLHAGMGTVLLTVAEHEELIKHRWVPDRAYADALAERDALRAEVERLDKQVEIANAVATCCKAGEAMARREIERLRKGWEDGQIIGGSGRITGHQVSGEDCGSVSGSGVHGGRTISLVAADTLDPRLGMPQPDGEPVEPMSAQSWKRRMYGS